MERTFTTRATQTPQDSDEKSTNTATKVEIQESSNDGNIPEEWRCGEPYKYSLPAPEGDPWQILLTPALEKDKAQCDAWKEEVQNLLIFAGLFSAVVTAFIIETYKGLQQNSNDTVILLLSRIADNLENSPNNSTINSSSNPNSLPPFSPTASLVRVNIFLFISLILSLTTVLIGIVSLQWLREHQAYYTSSFNPQNNFATYNMRSEALEKWRVPEIFSALPLILQSALILFFVGIVDFLLHIDIHVAVPVAFFIGLTLVFLLLTTILPTLQAFILHHPNLNLNDEVPVQCPYKSPQSRAFRRLITSSKPVFAATSFIFSVTYWMIMHLCLLPGQILNSSFCHSVRKWLGETIHRLFSLDLWPSYQSSSFSLLRLNNSKSWEGFDHMTPHIYEFWRVESSFKFDLGWLTIRDNYFQSTCNPDSWIYQNRYDRQEHGALYDAVLGLCQELKKEDINVNADIETPIFRVYHCVLYLSLTSRYHGDDTDEQIKIAQTRNAYLMTLLHRNDLNELAPLAPFPKIIQDPTSSLSLFKEENICVVLEFAHSKLYDLGIQSSPQLSQHLAEILFRLLGYLYSHPHLTYMSNNFGDGPSKVLFSADELYLMKIFDDKDQPFTTQWALTINVYFNAFCNPDVTAINFNSSFHSHPFIRDYIQKFWSQVGVEYTNTEIQSHKWEPIVLRTFNLIDDVLKNLLEKKTEHILNCVFYPAALYAQSCRRLLPDNEILNGTIDSLIPTLTRCKDVITTNGGHQPWITGNEHDEGQNIPALFSEEWWNVLFSSELITKRQQS